LTANLKAVSFHEAGVVSQLLPIQEGNRISIVILGFRPDNDSENRKELELLRQCYPASDLIVYADCVGQHKLFREYLKDIKAAVSKQENGTQLLCHLVGVINEHGRGTDV